MNILTKPDKIIIVAAKSRLQKLKARYNTISQTKFYMKRKGIDLEDVLEEDYSLQNAVAVAQKELSSILKTKVVDKSFLPNYMFSESDVVVVIGQDGLVANTAKYVHGIPIIGVNPEPDRFDGFLLPFNLSEVESVVEKVLDNRYNFTNVTMAKAKLDDGQSLLAFNDLFIGPQNHASARYKIHFGNAHEQQSSSGIIVSTGAGSTGWLSSLINMANGISQAFSASPVIDQQRFEWDRDELVYIVREPFLSKTSTVQLSAGRILPNNELKIESLMPKNGVIFSDGIQADYLEFNTGSIAHIGLAAEKAKLVTS
ncbi:MAG: sugar kinase [Bacteroidota bacterium]